MTFSIEKMVEGIARAGIRQTDAWRQGLARLACCVFCLLTLASASAQKELLFSFEYGAVRYAGHVDVDVLYQNVSKLDAGTIELPNFEEPCVLTFHNVDFGSEEFAGEKAKKARLVILRDELLAEGGIEFDQNVPEQKLGPGKKPVRFPFFIKQEGVAKISIQSFIVQLPDGQDISAKLASPFQISLNFKNKEAAANLPTPAPEPVVSEDEKFWVQENWKGTAGLDKYLLKYKGGEHSDEAKNMLRNAVRAQKKDAAEVFLRHFPGDGFAAEAKSLLAKIEEKEAPPPPEDLVKKTFDEIMGMKDLARQQEELKVFIKNYPNSEWARQAKRLVPVEITVRNQSADGLRCEIALEYAIEPEVGSISDTSKINIELFWDGKTPVLLVTLAQDGNYSVQMLDRGKETAHAAFEVSLGNVPVFKQIQTLPGSDTAYAILVSRGTAPFRFDFFKKNQRLNSIKLTTTDTMLVYGMEAMKEFLKVSGGSFEVKIEETDQNRIHPGGSFEIPEQKIPWAFILGGVALLAATVFLASHFRKKARRRKYEAKLRSSEVPPSAAVLADAIFEPAATNGTGSGEMINVEEPAGSLASSNVMLTIKSHKKAASQGNRRLASEEEFLLLVNASPHFVFDLTSLWQNTAITDLHFTQKSILDLDAFLRSQHIHELKETEGGVPEIGGFLLGRYFCSDEGLHRVTVEEFVPVTPQTHNVYQLEFSTAGIVQELGMAQEKFPDLALVAWFHTHPGHGLFLSSPDLTIHEGFFKEGYQFAMEIDSLKETLDTGFFTRATGGRMNNAADLNPQTSWFNWNAIEQAARTM